MGKALTILFLFILPLLSSAQVVFKENQLISSTTPSFGVLVGTGVGTSTIRASSTPVVASINATSTTVASRFPLLSLATTTTGCLSTDSLVVYSTGSACADALSGGTASMLASWLTSTTLTATSTPTASHYLATSTTGISRFAGDLIVSGAATTTSAYRVGGLFNVNGNATTTALGAFSTQGDITAGGLLIVSGTGTSTIAGNLSIARNLESLTGSVSYAAGGHRALSYNATSTTATSAFSGNVTVTGTTDLTGKLTAVYASTTAITASGTASTTNLTVSALTSAITLTGADGVFAEYTGTTCTNQAVTVLSALGAATCSSINNDYWSGTDLSVANGGTGLSTFGGANTILYTTAADMLASEAAFTYDSTANRLTADYASTTALTVSQSAYFATVSGNVGIGTTSPLTKVDIRGANQTVGAGYDNYGNLFVGTTDSFATDKGGSLALGGLYNTNGVQASYGKIHGKKEGTDGGAGFLNGYLAFETSNNQTSPFSAERMRITSQGNVGIGETVPQTKLHISGDDSAAATLITGTQLAVTNNGTAGNNSYINLQSGTTGKAGLTFGDSGDDDVSTIYHNNTGDVLTFTNSGTSMVLTSLGNVGIGTTTPNAKLSIFQTGNTTALNIGTHDITDSLGSKVFLQDSSVPVYLGIAQGANAFLYAGAESTVGVVATLNDFPLVFRVNNSEKVRITSDGNVGIGTTSPTDILGLSTSATTTLHIGGTSTTQGSCVQMYSPNRTAYRLYVSNAGTLTTEAGTCK